MLKTQTRPTHYTNKLDRSVVEKSKFASNPTQQYLDVALSRGSADLQDSRARVNKQGRQNVNKLPELDKRQTQKPSVPYNKTSSKGTVSGLDRRSTGVTKSEASAKSGFSSKTDPNRKDASRTFKEKARFESQKNQKLYQDLDDMLTGKHGLGFPPSSKHKKEAAAASATKPAHRREKISLVTKESLYPGISRDIKDKTAGTYKGQPVPPLQKAGRVSEESETWHAREIRAKQRLKVLDKIDDFKDGDYTKTTKIFDDRPVNRNQTVGVPVHQVQNPGRRHIVADIPIFVPPYGTTGQPFVTNVQTVPLDRAYQNAVPNANARNKAGNTGKLMHAPEGIIAPHFPGTGPFNPQETQYTVHNNPVLERQQFERAQREQAEIERENLRYFDTDPALDSTLPQTRYSSTEDKKGGRDKTLMSDPGPHRSGNSTSDGLEDLKYSPEGFLAEKRRQHRSEKESRMQQQYGPNHDRPAIRDNYVQGSNRDGNSYRERGEGYRPDGRSRVTDRENSWLRGSGRRPDDKRTYRKSETGYSGNTYRIPAEMDPMARSPEMAARKQGRETNRSYQSVNESKDRNRYSDRTAYKSYEEDREMQKNYASHLARERDAYEGDPGSNTEGGPDYRSRYKGSSDYPTGSGYPQDNGYGYSKGRSDRGSDRDRRSEPEDEWGDYSSRSRKEPKGALDNKPESLDKDTKDGEKKVQYVIRTKSGLSKSQMSQRSGPLPENIPPSATHMARKDDRSSRRDAKSSSTARDDDGINPQTLPRQDPIGSEKTKATVSEENDLKAKPVTAETVTDKAKETDDLNKYFDDAEDPTSEANRIPFYSDNVSKYSKQKNDYRNGDINAMTPVQETSMKHSEENDQSLRDKSRYYDKADKREQDIEKDKTDPYARSDRKDGKYVGGDGADDTPAKRYPSSTVNRHQIEDDRRSPWRRDDEATGDTQNDKPEAQDQSGTATLSGRNRGARGESSVEYIKERIREKTLEKMKERGRELSMDRQDNMFRKSKEKTMDSQGPDVEDRPDLGDKAGDDLDDVDEIEEGLEEGELYVCYLQTDSGDIIGPLRMDIDDVQLGLPKPLKKTEEEDPEGMRNRQTGSHGLNEFSSRSHSMLMLTIDSEMQDPDDENLYITKRGKLTFVDLAGSEKVKDSNSTADTLVESNSINKSLLVLGNCISSLGDHKRRQGHIPYRDSKLTKLLADSLGGNGVTLMICCITPASHHVSETMNTLRYASRAKKIRTKPVIKMDPREKLILSLKREIKVLRNENHYLREQLDFPAKPKGQLQKENDKNFAKVVKEANGKPSTNAPTESSTSNPTERIKQNGASTEEAGLYEMLQEYMVENEALRSENAEMQVVRDKVRQDQQLLYRDNERLMRRIDDLERKVAHASTSWQSMPRQGSHPQEVTRSRDHSPRGSPQYARGGGPPPAQPARHQPPADLPLRDNPALRDPVYPGSPPQGYASPTGSGNKGGKQPARAQPMKPPHRLADPIVGQQRPVNEANGGAYMNGHPPPNYPPQVRQAQIGSPNRVNDLRMDSRRSSQSSSSDHIRDMNEKLKHELMQLEGEIHHHTVMNTRTRDMYGSQGSMR